MKQIVGYLRYYIYHNMDYIIKKSKIPMGKYCFISNL